MEKGNTDWSRSVTGVVIRDGKVLLCRHTYGGGRGLLIVPGGYLNHGETPEDAVKREIMEETGVTVEPGELLGVRFGGKDWYAAFKAEYVSGEAVSDHDENDLVVWMETEEALARPDVPGLTKALIRCALEGGGFGPVGYDTPSGGVKRDLYAAGPEYEFSLAVPGDVPKVMALIEERIAWMDEKGIEQWNVTGYLEAYPKSYYEEQAAAGRLYVLRAGSGIIGAAVLLEEDERWEDCREVPAYYVHNLVTAISARGAGGRLLDFAGGLARDRGKAALRLDCAVDTQKLNAYYESRGFMPRGSCEDGPYIGIRREKPLK